jgi:hypothetical protein
MKNQPVTPQEQLQAQIEAYYHAKNQKIKEGFLEKLRQIEGITLSPNIACKNLSANFIELCVIDENNRVIFASETGLYPKTTPFGSSKNKISYASTGSFPIDDIGSYWRTIHAGECLKHWDAVCEIVNQTCQEYTDFCKVLDDLQNPEIDSEASEKQLWLDELVRLDAQVEKIMFPEPYDD